MTVCSQCAKLPEGVERLVVRQALPGGDDVAACPACGRLYHVHRWVTRGPWVLGDTSEEAEEHVACTPYVPEPAPSPGPRCPKCRSTDVTVAAAPIHEFLEMTCEACGHHEFADEHQRDDWYD